MASKFAVNITCFILAEDADAAGDAVCEMMEINKQEPDWMGYEEQTIYYMGEDES